MASAATQTLITSLYNGLLLREPTSSDISFWENQLDLELTTPSAMVAMGTSTSEFQSHTLKLASMFQAAFGRYGTLNELQTWKTVYGTGLTLAEIGQRFITSPEFSLNNPGLSDTRSYLKAMAKVGLGISSVPQADLDYYVNLVDSGQVNYGSLLSTITDVNGRADKVTLAMLYSGVRGTAPTSTFIDGLATSTQLAINAVLAQSSYASALTDGLSLVEDQGTLLMSGVLSGAMTLDLSQQTLSVVGTDVFLDEGLLADVSVIDAQGLRGKTVSFIGSAVAETYLASPEGGSLRGAGGADRLSGGEGADSFIFEATTEANGLDVISNFVAGGTDSLNFSAFLNMTNTASIAPVDATTTAEVAWVNGDVLVVVGDGLTRAEVIAGLFGAELPFAAPTARGKAVLIVSDIIGDTSVWYLVNQIDLGNITADELSQVAVLGGVNNTQLVPFIATNFA